MAGVTFVNCPLSYIASSFSLTNQAYDVGTQVGTTNYFVPSFSDNVCSVSTFTYSVGYYPNTPPSSEVVFSMMSMNFDWTNAITLA